MRISDWSSDVCSSDLNRGAEPQRTPPGTNLPDLRGQHHRYRQGRCAPPDREGHRAAESIGAEPMSNETTLDDVLALVETWRMRSEGLAFVMGAEEDTDRCAEDMDALMPRSTAALEVEGRHR